MRSRSQKVLAVAFLATALCADRAIIAQPALRAEAGCATLAGRLVARLTVNLRRVIPYARMYQARREESAREQTPASPMIAAFVPARLSPFQFRLPPPNA